MRIKLTKANCVFRAGTTPASSGGKSFSTILVRGTIKDLTGIVDVGGENFLVSESKLLVRAALILDAVKTTVSNSMSNSEAMCNLNVINLDDFDKGHYETFSICIPNDLKVDSEATYDFPSCFANTALDDYFCNAVYVPGSNGALTKHVSLYVGR